MIEARFSAEKPNFLETSVYFPDSPNTSTASISSCELAIPLHPAETPHSATTTLPPSGIIDALNDLSCASNIHKL
jgi:hypothetical protein